MEYFFTILSLPVQIDESCFAIEERGQIRSLSTDCIIEGTFERSGRGVGS